MGWADLPRRYPTKCLLDSWYHRLVFNWNSKKIKMSLYTPWRRLEGEEVELILDLGTRWGVWSASRPGRVLAPGK
jgi:hypothetical protein